jgi:hypothetical protein
MISIPTRPVRAALRRESEDGRSRLVELPFLVSSVHGTTGCEITGEALNGEVAVVVSVQRGADAAVLKISYPLSVTGGDAAVLRH